MTRYYKDTHTLYYGVSMTKTIKDLVRKLSMADWSGLVFGAISTVLLI